GDDHPDDAVALRRQPGAPGRGRGRRGGRPAVHRRRDGRGNRRRRGSGRRSGGGAGGRGGAGVKLLVLLGVLAGLGLLRLLRVRMLAWVAAFWLAAWVVLVHGFEVPVPWSVVKLFLTIVGGALLAYVTSDAQRWAE